MRKEHTYTEQQIMDFKESYWKYKTLIDEGLISDYQSQLNSVKVKYDAQIDKKSREISEIISSKSDQINEDSHKDLEQNLKKWKTLRTIFILIAIGLLIWSFSGDPFGPIGGGAAAVVAFGVINLLAIYYTYRKIENLKLHSKNEANKKICLISDSYNSELNEFKKDIDSKRKAEIDEINKNNPECFYCQSTFSGYCPACITNDWTPNEGNSYKCAFDENQCGEIRTIQVKIGDNNGEPIWGYKHYWEKALMNDCPRAEKNCDFNSMKIE